MGGVLVTLRALIPEECLERFLRDVHLFEAFRDGVQVAVNIAGVEANRDEIVAFLKRVVPPGSVAMSIVPAPPPQPESIADLTPRRFPTNGGAKQ